MNNIKKCFIAFAILMIGLGAGDAMRGIFSVIFSEHFSLSSNELSQIISISYVGNLIFLGFGGYIIDRINKKIAFQIFIIIWLSAQTLFAFTDNYICILIGMFFIMGTSTLLNTTINIVTPSVFKTSPAFFVNCLFFVQGIGTSFSQSIIGNWAKNFDNWHSINWGLIIIGIISFIIVAFCDFGKNKSEKKIKFNIKKEVFTSKFLILTFMMGCYFIAEHGVLNWAVIYGTNGLNMDSGIISNYIAIFFGGITIGRFIFGFIIDKLGIFKSLRYFSISAAILFLIGVIGGKSTLVIFSLSGLLFSIIYPTLVMSISKLWSKDIAMSISGLVISIASIADIMFNYLFGNITSYLGYKVSFTILPIFMCFYAVVMFLFSKKFE